MSRVGEDQEPVFEGVIGDIITVLVGIGLIVAGPVFWYYTGQILWPVAITLFGLAYTALVVLRILREFGIMVTAQGEV